MEATTHKRRHFLLALGLGAACAVSALLMRKRPEIVAEPQAATNEAAPVKGYHVSEHVKRYYRTTRV